MNQLARRGSGDCPTLLRHLGIVAGLSGVRVLDLSSTGTERGANSNSTRFNLIKSKTKFSYAQVPLSPDSVLTKEKSHAK